MRRGATGRHGGSQRRDDQDQRRHDQRRAAAPRRPAWTAAGRSFCRTLWFRRCRHAAPDCPWLLVSRCRLRALSSPQNSLACKSTGAPRADLTVCPQSNEVPMPEIGTKSPRLHPAPRRGRHADPVEPAAQESGPLFLPPRTTRPADQEGHRLHRHGGRISRLRALWWWASPRTAPPSMTSFIAKHGLGVILVSGRGQRRGCERYGVWAEKSMYGKTLHGDRAVEPS